MKKKIVVLVGETMNLDVMGCEVELALNVHDLIEKLDKEDVKDIIIESFDDIEYEGLKLIIKGASQSGKRFYFYVPNNEEDICGLADELDMEIYMYIEDIVKAIGL